jgi:anti-sigma B factor antagonist
MEIVKNQAADGVITLKISGKLSATTAEEFGVAANEAIAESKHIVMDFHDVSYLASAGLRVLVSSMKKTKAAGGSLVLKDVQENVQEVFEMTGLDDVFDIQ